MNARVFGSRSRISLTAARIAAASGFILAIATVASAQVSPSANHTTVGAGAGMDGAVSPTGGFGASVPLDLPSPRGSVPIPLSVVYTGSSRVGAAGMGWDVPISYVRRSTSTWRRKPYANSSGIPIGATRVTVSLGGQVHLMRDVGGAFWPARGESFMELREVAGEWSLKTLDNHEYVFRAASAMTGGRVGDTGLWLLAEVRDSIGGDKVVLDYSVPDVGSCRAGLALGRLAYTFDASATQPLYEIELGYSADWRPTLSSAGLRACATQGTDSAYPFEHVRDDATRFDRGQVLRSVRVKARNNLYPALDAKTIRRYQFDYDRDPATERPRLHRVTKYGEDGVAGTSIPIATYGYGALTVGAGDGTTPTISYGQPIAIPRTFLPGTSFSQDLSTTAESVSYIGDTEYKHTRLRHVIRDFTGDGLPDLVYKAAGGWVIHPNRLTVSGPAFGDPIPWSGPTEIQEQLTVRDTRNTAESRAKMVTTYTSYQFVDWDGDGRLDVVDVVGGSDKAHWKVWLNRAASGGGISWREVQVDITPLRDHLRSNGFVTDSDWIPFERARSWTRSDYATCTQQRCVNGNCEAAVECPATEAPIPGHPPIPAAHDYAWESDTMADWVVVDRNGDGYLDVVAGTIPVQHHEDGEWDNDGQFGEPVCVNVEDGVGAYVRTCRFQRRQWIDAIEWDYIDRRADTDPVAVNVSRRVEFLNRHGAFQGINGSPFTPVGQDVGEAAHGVTRWTTSLSSHEGPGSVPPPGLSPASWQTVGYVDENGDGVASLREVDDIQWDVPFPLFESNQSSSCPGANTYVSRQARGEVDLNGDGLADFISGQYVHFNLGAGYGPARRIDAPLTWSFELSRTVGYCGGGGRNEAGLTDLDGDGRPELLRVVNGQLWMSSLVAEGADVMAVQRLRTIDNGYGATTYVRYRNAKQDDPSTHTVPFPEIVVSETGVDVRDDSVADILPTYFAYGRAEMVYDPLAVSWVFPGYRRHVALRGVAERQGDSNISGTVTITDREPTAPAGSTYVQHVAAGRVAHVSQFEIKTPPAPALFLGWNGAPVHGQTSFVHAALQTANGQSSGNPPVVPPEALECGDLDPSTGALVGTALCRAAGLGYTRQTETWEGISAPPSLLNVLSGSLVDRVDQFGRPTLVIGKGDLRRTDDDVCTNITYATTSPDPKAATFPSVIADLIVTDCGWGRPVDGQPGVPLTIAGVHFRYDGLPRGQVSRGLLTARDVDRHGPAGLIASYEAERFTHNAMGEVESATTVRQSDGTTQATWFTYDAFGATVTQVGTQSSDVDVTLTATELSSTWPSIGSISTDHSGLRTTILLDEHGRTKQEIVEPAGGAKTTLRKYSYADGSPRVVTVDSFPGTTPTGAEDTAADRIRARTVLDALGRARYTQTELGADYSYQTLVSGFTVFDGLGRLRYQAATFEAPLGFSPTNTMALPYGTSFKYDARGRITREITSVGLNETASATSVASDLFVRQYSYGYEDGLAYVATRGADESDPASLRYQAHDDSWTTAIGRQVRRVRLAANGTRKDRVDQEWDRLGRVTETRRYLVPSTGVGAVVWRSTFDSLGNRLTLAEPGISTKTFEYDEAGNELWSWWMDGTTHRDIVTQYDGLGRVTDRLLTRRPAGGSTIIESHDRMTWDVPVGGADQPPSPLGGRLSAIETVGVGSTFFSYDAFGRRETTSYRYAQHNELIRERVAVHAGGRLSGIDLTTPRVAKRIQYEYDSAGRVHDIEASGDTILAVENVSALGQYRNVRYGNGVAETFEYSPFGKRQLHAWSAVTASGTYRSQNLEYDGAGRVTIETHETPTSAIRRTYTFDDLGRVTRSAQVGGAGAGTEDYTHDPLGNILTRTATTGTPNRYYTFDAADPDRLCRAAAPGVNGDCQFTYDGAGNVVADRTTMIFGFVFPKFYSFDSANRILSAQRGSATVSFVYGPAGRAKTVANGSFNRTVWHFGGLIEEVRPSGTTTIRTTFRIPGPLGIAASLRFEGAGRAQPVYTHGDARGGRFFTDEMGRVVQETVYSLFGRLFSNTSSSGASGISYTDELWNGGDHFPEVGLTILGARAYDAELGRFLERDPIMNTARSVTAHPYAFAFNDPATLTDPSGMQPAGLPNEQPHPLEWMMPTGSIFGPFMGNGPGFGAPGPKGASAPSIAMAPMAMGTRPPVPSATGTGIDPSRAARFLVRNSILNPKANLNAFLGFLRAGDAAVRHSLSISAECRLQAQCVYGKAIVAGIEAARGIDGDDLGVPSGAAIINRFCPGDDCASTSGEFMFFVLTAGESALLGSVDDVLHGFSADDLWRVWQAGSKQPLAWITPGSLPAAEESLVLQTLRHIDNGTVPAGNLGRRWGIPFRNWGGDLPGAIGRDSPYLEYRVAPLPGMSGPGALRIVRNSVSGEMYYTWTHYGDSGLPAFVRIR